MRNKTKLDIQLDGGTSIALKIKNETVCDSKAIYGKPEGHGHGMMGMGGEAKTPSGTGGVGAGDKYEGIIGMTYCDKPIKVTKGDSFTIESSVDFEKHPA